MTTLPPATQSLPYQKAGGKLSREQRKVGYIYNIHTMEDLDHANTVGKFPTRPSNLFLKVYSDVLRSLASRPEADISKPDFVATSGVVPMTMNAPRESLLQHYRDCIVGAEKEVLIAAGFWKVGKATAIITNALLELNARIARTGGPKVVVKILWGRGGLRYHKKNSIKQKTKLALPTAAEAPFLDIESMDMHKMVLGVFHVKYMIVDRKMLLITSTNIQDKQNVEFVVHMEGKIVDSFYSVFKNQWSLEFNPPLPLANTPAPPRSGFCFGGEHIHGACVLHSEHMDVPMILANKPPSNNVMHTKWDVPQNVAWLSAMHHAQRSIVIETPDFNASLAVNAVLDACRRGVSVSIRLSWLYNAMRERMLLQGGTNVHVMKKMYKKLMKEGLEKNLTVYFYVARTQINPTKTHPNHTKFMAVDDEIAVFGSGNMDTQSWHHSQETNIVVNSPLLVKEWNDLFKISQNTHIYGMIDPNHATESPLLQIKRMLAKNHTQPIPVYANTSVPIINNSEARVTSDVVFASNGNGPSYNNNFNKYYDTFRGIYNTPELNESQPIAPNTSNSITNSDFFQQPTNFTTTTSSPSLHTQSDIKPREAIMSSPVAGRPVH